MGVPPGEPRDGSQAMPAALIAQMAQPLLPPRLGVDTQSDGVGNLRVSMGGSDSRCFHISAYSTAC